jgi:endonuclease/exonuclease/phosphatase family metal-dependent hydrolase
MHSYKTNAHCHSSTWIFGIAMAALLTLGVTSCRQDTPRKDPPRRLATATATPTRELILVTYNVLANPSQASARIPSLLAILKATEADIIALQEVTPWFLQTLVTQPWVRRYHRTPTGPKGVAPGGLMILSRFPITRTLVADLPGRQGRKGLLADLLVNGATLAVLTCHLESPLTDGKTRATQLEVLFPLLQHAYDAVLLGDLNFGDKVQPETKRLPKTYRDLWTALRKDAPGYTWDNERSAMANNGAFAGEQSRRLDRILWRSAKWRPHTVRIIGTRPVASHKPALFPSDHFGLMGILQR